MKIRALSAMMAMLLAPAVHAELFISEYVEGSSNNKALELYNPTEQDISLSGYALKVYFNGATTATTIALNGTVPAKGTFVFAASTANATLVALSQQKYGSGLWNGDDAIVLEKSGKVIDSIGQVGVDPGSAWGNNNLGTENQTLRRKGIMYDTNTADAFDPSQEWVSYGLDNFSDIGLFNGQKVEPKPILTCGTPSTAISAIQGETDVSPFVGKAVEVEAVITQVLPGLKGYNIQAVGTEQDSNPQTSEGIFVFADTTDLKVNVGQRIRVLATVNEFRNHTQLSKVVASIDCGTATLPEPVSMTLPVTSLAVLEAVEGMLVHFDQTLTVNDTYTLSRFGELTLANGRRYTPTQLVSPGAEANAMAAAHALNQIVLDDSSTTQNPVTVPYPVGGLSATNTVRSGDTVDHLTGTVHYGFDQFRLMPTQTPQFVQTNARTAAPSLAADGNVKVASFNVLNYFNGDGAGAGFPTSRGADSAAEFQRQRAKILSALSALDASVIGLMEIENDGYAAESAIADLVNGLREVTGNPQWQFVAANGPVGTDEIAVGIIYRADLVSPAAELQILSSANSALDEQGVALFDDSRNRPVMAQHFRLLANDAEFAVLVSHLKSKGSACGTQDPDVGDGQGNCNLTRTRAAQAIGQFANQHFAKVPTLVIGDMNAYAKEDPITAFGQAGYKNVFEFLGKESSYSYVFSGLAGSLDHALLNEQALAYLADATKWNINADEPIALDYNVEFKSTQQQLDFYAPDVYRSSDHDPVVVSFNLPKPIPPLAANLTLERTVSSRFDLRLIQLNWTGAASGLTLYRDNQPVQKLNPSGKVVDQFRSLATSFTYKICDDATGSCSAELVVTMAKNGHQK